MGSSDYLITGANKIPFSTSKARNLTIASSEYEKYEKGWDIKLVSECSSGREVGEEGANDEKETACKDFGLFPPFEFFSSSGLTLGRIKSQQQKGEDA